jgi:cation-transporting ATPase 13A1
VGQSFHREVEHHVWYISLGLTHVVSYYELSLPIATVMEGATKLRAELEHSFQDLDDPNRRTQKIGWTEWMDMDMEELAAEKKRDKEKTVLDSLPKHMRVPNKHAPAFWPSLLLGITATLHALVVLLQVWSVGFNVQVNFTEVNAAAVQIPDELLEIDDALLHPDAEKSPTPLTTLPSGWPTHARIVPGNGERHVLVPLEYWPSLGMTLEYHRRRYVYDSEQEIWSKIRCRTDFELDVLPQWNGLSHCVEAKIRYGPNSFSVKQPSFGELYQKQLLNPFSVFQIFCVLLWAIDDYLVYSMFNLFMVLMFEGTVVFQRLQSLKSLRGMGNPSRLVYVHRSGDWIQVDTSALLPGDLVSLTRVQPHHAKMDSDKKKFSLKVEDDGGDIVPADLLLLRGSTVVNEASLTGESVPQMKEGLTDLEPGDALSIKGKHKMNVVYAGTKMLQCLGDPSAENNGVYKGPNVSPVSVPPDGGCLCFVLRTGFSSAQGKLVRMIEGSQEKVKGHERETGLLLLLLCVFAVISSGYVLYHGAQDEKRSKYELLLHCILIVTSVIRPELPMQMALAVNNSLMTLMKMHVFCTEPYRVPMAGKLDALLFDKTGTLTTDELVAVGVCGPSQLKIKVLDEFVPTPMAKTSAEAQLVLAGCHSLVLVDGETTGDPLELAALKAMHWEIGETGDAVPSAATDRKPAGQPAKVAGGTSINQVHIITRHHFSSKLQRMSCVVQAGGTHFAVAKGSPEAIGRLLGTVPESYARMSEYLAKQGFRVIALASKRLASRDDITAATESRAACEENLVFAGFISFTCMVRKDTADVLRRLKEGGMTVAMVTGDALLTAIHVAKEVDICEPIGDDTSLGVNEKNDELKELLQSKRRRDKKSAAEVKSTKTYKPIAYLDFSEKGLLYWKSYEDGTKVADFVARRIPELAQTYDLATTGKCLAASFEQDGDMTRVLEHIRVFARMTPDAKETVIECLHSVDKLCLMCGDGANDVGALKQADVGVALLSGFGNVNVEKAEGEVKEEDESSKVTAFISQDHLDKIRAMPVRALKLKLKSIGTDPYDYPELKEKEDLVKLYQIKSREAAIQRHEKKNKLDKAKMTKAEMAAERKREQQERQQRMMARVEELTAQGEQWATWKAMQEFWAEEKAAAKKKALAAGKGRGIEGSAASLVAQFEDIDMESGELPMVKLGDASIAAPFTSKMPSIKSCVDIVRQGRCTLVSSIQMYQIMALQCLISSYSLSVLYLDGVKYGDSQMTAMGLLGSVSFMSVSRSKPLDKLSRVRPLNSIFHPALFASLLAQFAVHFGTMILAVQTAKTHLPPDYEPDLDGQFKPGILNTVVFLVSSVQQVTVFVVNLQGRPFMTGLTENTPLLWSLIATFILTFMFASESVPGLNRYFQLVPFPEEGFRDFVLTILAIDVVACYLLDRLMKFLFARDILLASFEKGMTSKEVSSLVRAFGIVGMLMYAIMGNSDQWDELIEMEKNLTLNATDILESVTECVGESCEAAQELIHQTMDTVGQEF